RGAARRMADTLGEDVGGTVGLRARLETRVSARTRIEVITEGVFTRMILDDPALTGVAAVLFDEFHERSLDADLGLALALDAQAGLREDLRLVVMSATLDGARTASLLAPGGAPIIESEGRMFPVETRHLGRDPAQRIEDQMTAAILAGLRAEPGSVLAFLPGQGEILRVADRLGERIRDPGIEICPLYGAMDVRGQDRAIRPADAGRRKVVLATSIAETSLTIEGVRVVVDSGLARAPRYEPDVGITRLETVRVSRAAADQRRGRAGRTEPGVCYRLWDEAQTQSLPAFARPEILDADLAGLLLDLAEWGVRDPATLTWLDPPPGPALAEARSLLEGLGALTNDGTITPHGRALRALPLPPRLAAMVVRGTERGQGPEAAEIAALLSERGLGGTATDLTHRLDAFHRQRGGRAEDMRRLAASWAKSGGNKIAVGAPLSAAGLLALAYPERVARRRGAPGQFLLANGRAAAVDPTDSLAKAPFLVVAELTGTAAQGRILTAAPLEETEALAMFTNRIITQEEVSFDPVAASLRARRIKRLDAIILASDPLPIPPGTDSAAMLADGVARLGIHRLAFSKAQKQWRDRIAFLHAAEGEDWPDVSDAGLAASVQDWLAPFVGGITALSGITPDVLGDALASLLPHTLRRRLDVEAPTHFVAPTGLSHPIDYESEGAPVLAIRVQELFGLTNHPSIARGQLPLTLHLLSPAHRPIQITRDLPGFWAGSWASVRAEMRGRYPKHPWPDDPARAAPTHRAKPRGT
ncbi:MAG TPA: ATP-dependent helicase HrpB, partial [Beijerinckiaceae bacterium]|nr:ATP-dependent helicase HrpB [Beijerinckiaceae bacterium]